MKSVFLTIFFLSFPLATHATVTDKSADPASKAIQSVNELKIPQAQPRISGSVQSYLFLSQRTQMKPLAPGAYARKNLNVFPFYEIMSVRADNLGHPGISVHLQTIAGLDLADVYLDNRFIADPVFAYVQFQHKGLDAKLGRQLIFSGATEGLHIDGIRLSYHSPLYLGLEAFAGLLVSSNQGPDWYQDELTNDYDTFGRGFTDWEREGDYAVGGRIFYSVSDQTNAGVSLLHLEKHSEVASQLLGADLDMAPAKWISIFGKANIDLTALALRDAGGYIDFYIGSKSNLGVHFRHINPTIYISQTSIFSVFSNEKHNAVGASFAVLPIKRLSLDMSYSQLFFSYYETDDAQWKPTTQTGHEIEVDASFKFGSIEHFGIARIGAGRIAREQSAVNQIRLGALIPISTTGLKSSANAYIDLYNEPILNRNFSVLGDVGIFYYTPKIRTGASFRAGYTPYSDTEISGMVTFAYNFLTTFSK